MTVALSILLPVFNAQPYLAAALDSMLNQTFRDYELILLDDGSTDGSGEMLREYARRDRRIRLIQRGNKGLVATLNEGLALAQGEFIGRMDADDVAFSERFARQIAYLQEHSECVAVGSQVLFIDARSRPIGPRANLLVDHAAIDQALLAGQWPLVHPTLLMRRTAVQKIGGYRDYLTWEDHDLFLRLAEVGKLANLPEVLLKYRLHLGSVVHQRGNGRSAVLQEILQQADQRRGLPVRTSATLPVYQAPSRMEHQRTWAWWALAAGNQRTAAHYAWQALKSAPWSVANWKLLACAWRGR